MEKRSTHYGDVSKWIEKVIDSCETRDQLFSAKRLIYNFQDKLIRDLGYINVSTIIDPINVTWKIRLREVTEKSFKL
jgi:hypothetical protein